MAALVALGLFIAIQGVLCASTPCSGDIKAKTRDGVTCYECGKSPLPTPTEQWSTVGRLAASPGDFPWSAAFYNVTTMEDICGGTLISSQAVITTASCVTTRGHYRPEIVSEITVVLGNTYRSWEVTEPSVIKRQVKEIRVHPNYKGRSLNYANDLALLILDSEVPFSSAVMPACLDYNHNQLPLYETNAIGYASGFGYKEECESRCPNPSERLTYTSTNVLSFDECVNKTETFIAPPLIPLTPDRFCIGNFTVSPIQVGDLGRGFTLISDGLHYVTGVANLKMFSLGESRYSFGTLVNVTHHMDWIKSNLPE